MDMHTRNFKLVIGALLLQAFVVAPASASTIFNWTFTDNSSVLVASGTVTTAAPVTLNIPGPQTVYAVLSGTGSVLGVDGFTAENLTLYGSYTSPLSYNTVAGETYDNAVIGETPHVDGNGLEFMGNTSGSFFNIYNNINTGFYAAGNYPNSDIFWISGGPSANGTFDISAVPEPAIWTTMLLGFFGIGFMLRRTRNASAFALA